MRAIVFALLALAGCTDDGTGASSDAALEPSCCDLLPDEDAVRSCVVLPPDTCGVIACPIDGGFTKINVCGPRSER